MNKIQVLVLILIAVFICETQAQTSVNDDFTYQGELKLNDGLAHGSFDFRFILNSKEDGTGDTVADVIVEGVDVNNGIFTTTISPDNGGNVFTGNQVWMQINVRDGASIGAFEALSPRQLITSSPYATHAQSVSPNSVGSVEIDSSEVQRRIAGTCEEGSFVTSIEENGLVVCSPENLRDHQSVCKRADGTAGVIINNVCLLNYNATMTSDWNTAATACLVAGGDLCSASQYYQLGNGEIEDQLFYSNLSLWSDSFSDNDGGALSFVLHGSDNPSGIQTLAYGCCSSITPEPYRSAAKTIGGVTVTYIHTNEDTTWKSASKVCLSAGSDLCSKSQYVVLNDNNIFASTDRLATSQMSDNDAQNFSSIIGTNAQDNPLWQDPWAYACCGNSQPLDLSCPGTLLGNNLCILSVHDTEDTDFLAAARSCASQGGDICSNSQMQGLRNVGMFSGKCWTNDGADNDGTQVGGLLATQPDNPDPALDKFGYACCY
jgi:hypothetical protein